MEVGGAGEPIAVVALLPVAAVVDEVAGAGVRLACGDAGPNGS